MKKRIIIDVGLLLAIGFLVALVFETVTTHKPFEIEGTKCIGNALAISCDWSATNDV